MDNVMSVLLGQLSLFGTPSLGYHLPEKVVPEKTPERHIHAFPFEKISQPTGQKDKRGLYAYEALHRKMEKINPKARILLFQLMEEHGIDLIFDVISIGVIWKSQKAHIQMDYQDAIKWYWG